MKVTLAAYWIQVRRTRSKEYLNLDDIGNKDLFTVAKACLGDLTVHDVVDRKSQRYLRLKPGNLQTHQRRFSGFLEKGDYGLESDLVDADSGGTSYRRRPTDAELLPFHFQMWLPKGVDQGILIIQRVGLLGATSLFAHVLRERLRVDVGGVALELTPIVPEEWLEQMVSQGAFLKLTYKASKIPHDYADLFDGRKLKQTDGSMEFSLIAKRGNRLAIKSYVRKIFRSRRDVNRLFGVKGFEDSKIVVKVRLDGQERTIDLSGQSAVRPVYDVTQDVSIGENGHPTRESIQAAAESLLDALRATDAQVRNV